MKNPLRITLVVGGLVMFMTTAAWLAARTDLQTPSRAVVPIADPAETCRTVRPTTS